MNDDTLADGIQIVATLIALLGVAVSFVFSWQGQKLQKRQALESAREAAASNQAAQAAAQRAAAAAALTIDDLARIASALERLAAPARAGVAGAGASAAGAAGGFESRAALAAPAWQLRHDAGDRYRLTNVGTAPAFDVWVGGSASLDGPHGVSPGADVAAGASVGFQAAVLPTTTDSAITVTWAPTRGADGAARSSWRYPLPGA